MEESSKSVCRCCLTGVGSFKSMLSEVFPANSSTFFDYFLVFSGISCEEETNPKICHTCERKLSDAFEFRELIIRSNASSWLEITEGNCKLSYNYIVLKINFVLHRKIRRCSIGPFHSLSTFKIGNHRNDNASQTKIKKKMASNYQIANCIHREKESDCTTDEHKP
jgi:hypothetical protein